MGEGGLFFVEQRHAPAGTALAEGVAVTGEEGGKLLGLLVACRGRLGALGQAGLDGLEVLYLELQVNDFLVADWVDGAVHMDYIAVVEAAEDVEYGVAFADVGEELVAQALSPARTLDEARYVDYIDRGGDCALGMAYFGKHLKAPVGYIGGAEVGLDGTEGEVGTLGLAAAYAVEQCGLSHVRQTDYSAFERHLVFGLTVCKNNNF